MYIKGYGLNRQYYQTGKNEKQIDFSLIAF